MEKPLDKLPNIDLNGPNLEEIHAVEGLVNTSLILQKENPLVSLYPKHFLPKDYTWEENQ